MTVQDDETTPTGKESNPTAPTGEESDTTAPTGKESDMTAPPATDETERSTTATNTHADEDSAPSSDESGEPPVPTAQPASLRRQQLFVGASGAVLVALAIVVSLLQQFPTLPFPVVLLAGVLGGLGMAWLVLHSVFPGEGEPPGQ